MRSFYCFSTKDSDIFPLSFSIAFSLPPLHVFVDTLSISLYINLIFFTFFLSLWMDTSLSLSMVTNSYTTCSLSLSPFFFFFLFTIYQPFWFVQVFLFFYFIKARFFSLSLLNPYPYKHCMPLHTHLVPTNAISLLFPNPKNTLSYNPRPQPTLLTTFSDDTTLQSSPGEIFHSIYFSLPYMTSDPNYFYPHPPPIAAPLNCLLFLTHLFLNLITLPLPMS
ncbi:unnamed protein product [Acanthosepion pharaonis]|uniref:Uncharacterized protein n=1 Tax=Acanthosepion pharaonis TaxID=158019 RepID=A0A812B9J4_ACAPH|nr:unnamed protein product [Sepia pharaonis]